MRPAASGPLWVSPRDMGKVRGLRARVHQAAVRLTAEASPGLAPPAQEKAPPQASAGGVGRKVNLEAALGGWGWGRVGGGWLGRRTVQLWGSRAGFGPVVPQAGLLRPGVCPRGVCCAACALSPPARCGGGLLALPMLGGW